MYIQIYHLMNAVKLYLTQKKGIMKPLIIKYAIHSPLCNLNNRVPGLIDLTNIIPDVYSSYPKNEHHWTTSYVWNKFIPRLADDIALPFNYDEYKLVPCIYDNQCLDYHIPIDDSIITIHDLYYNQSYDIPISNTVFYHNYKSPFNASTGYHKLFMCAHRCATIYNKYSKTNRNLLLNTYSMSVPLMHILMCYFRNILILDNRTNTSYKSYIHEFMQHDNLTYMELFIADSYNFHKYAINLK